VSRARGFAGFWLSFLVGDDWRLTVGALLALAATMLLEHTGMPAWWLLPAALAVLLAESVRRATRRRE